MPRTHRITVRDEPAWVRTPAQRRRGRRNYTVVLLARLGLSTRFIADALGANDSYVRQILRSEKTSLLRFPKAMAGQEMRDAQLPFDAV
jgi:hypothetical protein